MTKLVLHEIDGTDTVIMADLADDHFIWYNPLMMPVQVRLMPDLNEVDL